MTLPDFMPATCYPPLLLLDADQQRAQATARLFTLADYQPLVASSPYQAWQRLLRERFVPHALLVGRVETHDAPILSRLIRRIEAHRGQTLPIIPLPNNVAHEVPLLIQQTAHILVTTGIVETVDALCTVVRPRLEQRHSLVLDLLPGYGLMPRISQQRRSRNHHFRQILSAARAVIGAAQWETLMLDVGLAHYRDEQDWPPDNDEYAIPAEEVSCIHQAVARSSPADTIAQIRRWSIAAMQIFVQQYSFSILRQIALRSLPEERLIERMLNGFTQTMNEIRGEPLHLWLSRRDGSYWLIHYSNLYVFGRTYRTTAVCHVWLAALETLLGLIHCEQKWEVSEKECSCQTQTGHCVFELRASNTR